MQYIRPGGSMTMTLSAYLAERLRSWLTIMTLIPDFTAMSLRVSVTCS